MICRDRRACDRRGVGPGPSHGTGFGRAGAKVAALDLRPGEASPGVMPIACNVADDSSVIAALDAAEAADGVARIVVNCAGIPGSMRLVGREGPVDMARFSQVIGVNLLATVSMMTKAAARMMTLDPLDPDGERGVIVNTSSITAFEGQIGQGAYVASKGAIAAMTIQVAREFAANGVQVLAIAPGLFHTPMAADVPPEVDGAITSDAIFLRCFGEPEDFADLRLSMIQNPMLNGEVIRLDAGVRLRAR